MTKRFEYKNNKVYDNLIGETHSSNMVSVNVLNELHEENQDLKSFNQDLAENLSACANARISKDNRIERLEEKIQRERTSFMKTHRRWSKEAETKIKELAEENEQLKSEYKLLHTQYQDLKKFVENNFNEYLTQEKLNRQIIKLEKENEQLKKELKVYHKLASCSNCRYHDYDWDINDGYGGEEYEVCDKGNDVIDGICEGWEEF